MEAPRNFFTVGRFGKVHGVAGQIRLFSTTDFPDRYFRPGHFRVTDGREIRELEIADPQPRPGKNRLWLVRVSGWDTARLQTLTGWELQLPVHQRVRPTGNQFYAEDLVGLAVVDEAGTLLGEAGAVDSGVANDVLWIRGADGREWSLPFVRSHVLAVDVAAGRIRVRIAGEEEVR